ncbi:MAG: Hsp20/alpha crystallin family protein [Spirochaetales bacterium]|nr:Hsp20/alpha crystallin family protein [Spirochaetales bacterium]
MTLVRFNPARRLVNMRSDMDRFFEDFFGGDLDHVEQYGGLRPLLNMEENDDEYVVTVDVPGIAKNEIKITYQEGVLSISGEKKAEKEMKEGNFHRFERRYGKFCRNVELPSTIIADRISADYQNGVLTVKLPKAEEVKPKQIEVKVK